MRVRAMNISARILELRQWVDLPCVIDVLGAVVLVCYDPGEISTFFSKNSKITIYKTIILPVCYMEVKHGPLH